MVEVHLDPVTETLNLRADPHALAARLSELQAAPSRGGTKCTVAVTLDKARATSPEVAAMLEVAFDDPATQAGPLSALVEELGWDVPSGVIQRHRRRLTSSGCRCPK